MSALVTQDEFDTEFEPQIELQDNLFAPIAQGQVVGKITYTIDGIQYSSNLLASHSVEQSGFITIVVQIILVILILFLLYKLLFDSNSNKKSHRKKLF